MYKIEVWGGSEMSCVVLVKEELQMCSGKVEWCHGPSLSFTWF